MDIVERLKADELPNDRQLQREARATLRGLLNEAATEIERLREALITISSVDVDVIVSEQMWSDMSPKDIYEKGLMNGAMAVRYAVKTEAYAILALGEKE